MTCWIVCGRELAGSGRAVSPLDLGAARVRSDALNVDPVAAEQLRLSQCFRIHILIRFGGARVVASTPRRW